MAESDPDNPEWTPEDFARAMGPESLPAEILAAFPRTRGGTVDQILRRLSELKLDNDALDVPVVAFGGRTMREVMAEGNSHAVLDHLETLADGGYV